MATRVSDISPPLSEYMYRARDQAAEHARVNKIARQRIMDSAVYDLLINGDSTAYDRLHGIEQVKLDWVDEAIKQREVSKVNAAADILAGGTGQWPYEGLSKVRAG